MSFPASSFNRSAPQDGGVCPFRQTSGGVALEDLPAIVRVRDRARFKQAIRQLERSIEIAEDLDEARAQGLMFLAVVMAGLLETDGPRSMVRQGLEAARKLDNIETRVEIKRAMNELLIDVAGPSLIGDDSPTDRLVNLGISYIGRHFTEDISDADVARHIGTSTSHFRALLRQATGQPFHQYILGVRLERARQLLETTPLSVAHIAQASGFHSISTFNRRFTHRFRVSPLRMKRCRMDIAL